MKKILYKITFTRHWKTGGKKLLMSHYENITEMPDDLLKNFVDFCYPKDMEKCKNEIEIDKKCYWPYASTFIVFYKKDNIAGSVLFIQKNEERKLPVEKSFIASGNGKVGDPFNVYKDIGNHKVAEIYRLRKSFEVKPRKGYSIIRMLFKAVWVKVVQTNTEYLYCTVDPDKHDLIKLYTNLGFDDIGVNVNYIHSSKEWKVLRLDCLKFDKYYSTKGRFKFSRMKYFRKNLKKILLIKTKNKIFNLLEKIRLLIDKLF